MNLIKASEHTPERSIDRLSDPVVLVDTADRPLGSLGKLAAHERGLRHRAVSVIVRDQDGRLMLQRRHPGKYHSGGLWANTCCGHPRPGEPPAEAAARRLKEEMGFACPLTFVFRTEYRAAVSDGLTEHEIVHVFSGVFDGVPQVNPDEVVEWRWSTFDTLRDSVDRNPELYAVWFRMYVRDYWSNFADGNAEGRLTARRQPAPRGRSCTERLNSPTSREPRRGRSGCRQRRIAPSRI